MNQHRDSNYSWEDCYDKQPLSGADAAPEAKRTPVFVLFCAVFVVCRRALMADVWPQLCSERRCKCSALSGSLLHWAMAAQRIEGSACRKRMDLAVMDHADRHGKRCADDAALLRAWRPDRAAERVFCRRQCGNLLCCGDFSAAVSGRIVLCLFFFGFAALDSPGQSSERCFMLFPASL